MKARLGRISRGRWIVIGLVLAALAIAAVFIIRGRANAASPYQTQRAERGTLTATVGATGTVRARQSAVLLWQATGTVERVDVEVGAPVVKDAVLATLEKTSLPQNVILAEADLVDAQQSLEDLLKSDTARAKAIIALRDARDAYDQADEYRQSLNNKIDLKKVTYVMFGGQRFPQVKYYKGYADAETIAKADEDLALKKAALDDAQRTYDRLKDGPNAAEVAGAEARVAAAQATLNMGRVAAPFAGTVTQVEAAPGDQVSAGQVAFRVDDLSDFLVDVQVSEVDINSVSLGQEVTLTFDAILGKTYHGKVVEVGQAGNADQGVVNFTVTVQVTDADQLVKPGMTAGVNIVVTQLKDVLLVPNRAVRVVDGKRVVYVLRDGQPVKVTIRLGPSSDTYSALADGNLKEGDPIVLNPPIEFQPGAGPRGGGGPF
ncbi:MAG TPA: efflux RND transporter periplasmic adaptor subunit [Anaerolineales bacterium]